MAKASKEAQNTQAGSAQESAQQAQPQDQAQEQTGGQSGGRTGKLRPGKVWFEEGNREIVVYYLIAVCFLELIVGAIAFFYGVTQAVPVEPGGPKMARFPWVGWLVAAVLSPVGLLLLLHLSGQFFSRALNGGESGGGGQGAAEGAIPQRVQRFYTIVRHAPTIVILLALVALGCTVLFVDSAMEMAMAVGAALRPYILWIIGGVVAFFVIGYLGRLWFLARHRRLEQEYAYRMKVLETTGIVIMNKNCVPLRYEDGQLQLLASQEDGQLKALPDAARVVANAAGTGPSASGASTAPTGQAAPQARPAQDVQDVEDATILSGDGAAGGQAQGRANV